MKSQLSFVVYPAVVALSLAAAVGARAESPTVDDSAVQQWAQTKSSEQVRAELMQARADGTTKVWSISYNPLHHVKAQKSREQVRAEVLAQRTDDSYNVLVGEDSGSFYLAQNRQPRETAPVLAQTRR